MTRRGPSGDAKSDKSRERHKPESQVQEYYRQHATEEDDAIAKAASRAARRLTIEDAIAPKKRR